MRSGEARQPRGRTGVRRSSVTPQRTRTPTRPWRTHRRTKPPRAALAARLLRSACPVYDACSFRFGPADRQAGARERMTVHRARRKRPPPRRPNTAVRCFRTKSRLSAPFMFGPLMFSRLPYFFHSSSSFHPSSTSRTDVSGLTSAGTCLCTVRRPFSGQSPAVARSAASVHDFDQSPREYPCHGDSGRSVGSPSFSQSSFPASI